MMLCVLYPPVQRGNVVDTGYDAKNIAKSYTEECQEKAGRALCTLAQLHELCRVQINNIPTQ